MCAIFGSAKSRALVNFFMMRPDGRLMARRPHLPEVKARHAFAAASWLSTFCPKMSMLRAPAGCPDHGRGLAGGVGALVRPCPLPRDAPMAERGRPRHARPGPCRTISRSGSRTETRNVPQARTWLRNEACPRGSGAEVERPNDRRTEAWRRASGMAPCRECRRRQHEGLADCPEEGCSEAVMLAHGFYHRTAGRAGARRAGHGQGAARGSASATWRITASFRRGVRRITTTLGARLKRHTVQGDASTHDRWPLASLRRARDLCKNLNRTFCVAETRLPGWGGGDSNSNIRVRTMYLRNRDEFPSAPSQRATRDRERCRTSGLRPGAES